MRLPTLSLLTILLAGCATPVIMLKNDKTGDIVRCGGQGIGAGRTMELTTDEQCVRDYEVQGYRRTSAAAEALAARPVPPPPRPAPATNSLGESRWLITAEGLAKADGCMTPYVLMVSKGAGSEAFTAACQNGSTLALRCDFDGCRIVR